MKVSYGMTIPKPERKVKTEEHQHLLDFNANPKHQTMCFAYEDEKQARNKMTTIRNLIKREGWDITAISRGNNIYLEKK